ncbi:hypothetical protein IC232_03780 [Microvirga sp. BT688]|uniref:hypothetical protein n=1 Tax=Microvirga sp. TaxID=1873136 RepID=UPI001681C71C|nr:hypothetical protein [Microvirga sp.]MBD2745811.1 hypothetical protein [Microvirga sp.]
MTVLTTIASPVPQEGTLQFVDGPLAKLTKDEAVAAMSLLDRRRTEQDITFSGAAQTRRFYQADLHFTTTFKRLSYETPGRTPYKDVPCYNNKEQCEDEARRKVAEWAKPDMYTDSIRMEMIDEKAVAKFFSEGNGTVDLPRRRVVSHTYRHCGACKGQSTVECGDCSGKGFVGCPSRKCYRGREQCWHCMGDHRGVYVSTTGQWMRCPICYGDKTVICQTCDGDQWVYCGCDKGQVGCSPCHASGWFTFRIEAHGETRFSYGEPVMGGLGSVRPFYDAWKARGFPGANRKSDAGSEPFIKKTVSTPVLHNDGTIRCVASVSGTVGWSLVTGNLKGKAVKGFGIHLDKPYVAFEPFLDEIAAEITKEVVAGDPGPMTMEKRTVNQPILYRLLGKIARTKESYSSQMFKEICEPLNGALTPDALRGLAASYSTLKDRFASTLWGEAKTMFALMILPLAFLYVFLNVPHLLQSGVPLLAENVNPLVTTVVPAFILMMLPTWLVRGRIDRKMQAEFGKSTAWPAKFNRNLFSNVSLALLVLVVVACLSPYVTGPKGDGMYLAKSWLFRG